MTSTTRWRRWPVGLVAAWVACSPALAAAPAPPPAVTLETEYLRYVIGADGHNIAFADKRTDKDYCAREPRTGFVHGRKEGKTYGPVACSAAGDLITVTLGESAGTVTVRAVAKRRYVVLEVVSVSDPKIEEVTFGVVRVTCGKRTSAMAGVVSDDEFAAGARALNLGTNLRLHGGPAPLLAPYGVSKHGLAGAKVALVGCPPDQLRSVLQDVVRDEGLLHSPLGGPFALDAEENRGSYVFAAISEQNADEWIALARKAGMAEVHLMGFERSLGHYEPRKEMFPSGLDGLKAVVARIHAAGLRAGMHTLTGGIAPHDPFITPVPDKRLAKDATFALAEALGEGDTAVRTVEAPGDLDTMWAYMGRGNVLQIEDELIQYTGLAQAPPHGFTGCARGVFGTKARPHARGAPVHHLFVRYGLFQPDENGTLVDDVAECIARAFNACGFDMIYLDGLEGMPGGSYGEARIAAAIFSRLKGRVLVEASNWVYHNWPFHSRLGAYDYPHWGLKRFVDIHCRDMEGYRASSLLAAQLGWWAVLGPSADHPAEFPDEIEYLCCKSLAYDAPMSFEEIEAGPKPRSARQNEYLEMIGRWERLRLARYFSAEVRGRLKTPREEFRLVQAAGGAWQLVPTDYATHKVTGLKDGSDTWLVRNRFGAQAPRLRIEALYAAAPYDSPDAAVLARFETPEEFAVNKAADGVKPSWAPVKEPARPGTMSGRWSAASARKTRTGGWAGLVKTLTPPMDLRKCGALGVWIHGDGKGELLNFQLTNPLQFWQTWDEHYVTVDFTGWRYVELHLRERDADRHGDYEWPYGGTSAIFRSPLIRNHVSGLSIWYNDLAPGDTAECYLGPVKALPVAKVKLKNVAVTAGGKTVVFPVDLESGQYIEMESPTDCRLYDERGAVVAAVSPQGETLRLDAGDNKVGFTCQGPDGPSARARVTVITQGEPLGSPQPPQARPVLP